MPDSCPICGKARGEHRFRPFCSAHCAQVDLGRWFTGSYAIPAAATEADDDGDGNPLDPRPEVG